jgi:hypothetical protein
MTALHLRLTLDSYSCHRPPSPSLYSTSSIESTKRHSTMTQPVSSPSKGRGEFRRHLMRQKRRRVSAPHPSEHQAGREDAPSAKKRKSLEGYPTNIDENKDSAGAGRKLADLDRKMPGCTIEQSELPAEDPETKLVASPLKYPTISPENRPFDPKVKIPSDTRTNPSGCVTDGPSKNLSNQEGSSTVDSSSEMLNSKSVSTAGTLKSNDNALSGWGCQKCTYWNNQRRRRCELCNDRKPVESIEAPASASKSTSIRSTTTDKTTPVTNYVEMAITPTSAETTTKRASHAKETTTTAKRTSPVLHSNKAATNRTSAVTTTTTKRDSHAKETATTAKRASPVLHSNKGATSRTSAVTTTKRASHAKETTTAAKRTSPLLHSSNAVTSHPSAVTTTKRASHAKETTTAAKRTSPVLHSSKAATRQEKPVHLPCSSNAKEITASLSLSGIGIAETTTFDGVKGNIQDSSSSGDDEEGYGSSSNHSVQKTSPDAEEAPPSSKTIASQDGKSRGASTAKCSAKKSPNEDETREANGNHEASDSPASVPPKTGTATPRFDKGSALPLGNSDEQHVKITSSDVNEGKDEDGSNVDQASASLDQVKRLEQENESLRSIFCDIATKLNQTCDLLDCQRETTQQLQEQNKVILQQQEDSFKQQIAIMEQNKVLGEHFLRLESQMQHVFENGSAMQDPSQQRFLPSRVSRDGAISPDAKSTVERELYPEEPSVSPAPVIARVARKRGKEATVPALSHTESPNVHISLTTNLSSERKVTPSEGTKFPPGNSGEKACPSRSEEDFTSQEVDANGSQCLLGAPSPAGSTQTIDHVPTYGSETKTPYLGSTKRQGHSSQQLPVLGAPSPAGSTQTIDPVPTDGFETKTLDLGSTKRQGHPSQQLPALGAPPSAGSTQAIDPVPTDGSAIETLDLGSTQRQGHPSQQLPALGAPSTAGSTQAIDHVPTDGYATETLDLGSTKRQGHPSQQLPAMGAASPAGSTQTIDPVSIDGSATKTLDLGSTKRQRHPSRHLLARCTSPEAKLPTIPTLSEPKTKPAPSVPPLQNSTNRNAMPLSSKSWMSNKSSRKFLREMDGAAQAPQITTGEKSKWITARKAPDRAKATSSFIGSASKKKDSLWDESQSQQPNYPYKETVRCQAIRKGLPCHDCESCRSWYQMLKETGHEFSQDPLENSRHRSRFQPSETPVDFWELDFIDERDAARKKEAEKQEARRRGNIA